MPKKAISGRKAAFVVCSVAEHAILRDKFNWIVRHPWRKGCKGRKTGNNLETYFTQPRNVRWELETCCKVNLTPAETQELATQCA